MSWASLPLACLQDTQRGMVAGFDTSAGSGDGLWHATVQQESVPGQKQCCKIFGLSASARRDRGHLCRLSSLSEQRLPVGAQRIVEQALNLALAVLPSGTRRKRKRCGRLQVCTYWHLRLCGQQFATHVGVIRMYLLNTTQTSLVGSESSTHSPTTLLQESFLGVPLEIKQV